MILLLACALSGVSSQPVEPPARELAQEAAVTGAPEARPNVIIVLVDDLGWADLGVGLPGIPGVQEHRTPHVASFARESLSCIRAYSSAPNCAPSRATLQTGRATPRHGVLTVGSPKRGKAKDRALEPPESRVELLPEEVTLAELVKTAGYASAHVGKWHLGDDPQSQGYDVNVGGNLSGHPKSYFAPYKNASLEDGPDGELLTTRLTDETIDLLDELEAPFLINLCYYAVHTPLQATEERVADRRAAGAQHPRYAAMIEALDEEFGRLLKALEERELAENTVVIFTSDNGGYGPATNKRHTRGYKGTLDEGGVRVPFFIRWPSRIRPTVSPYPVHHQDVFPTVAAISGASLPAAPIDGINLLPHFRERAPLEDRTLYWHFPCYLQGSSDRFEKWRTTPGTALTESGRWKLIHFYESRSDGTAHTELYDIANDPREEFDLAAKYPEKVKALMREMVTWRKETSATVPSRKKPSVD
ncbi:MAG: sulfatase [Planctomycetota bacterium]